jgi:hypothetical protein
MSHGGGAAAQCSSIANNLETSMSAVVVGATNVSFWWKASCQTNDDYLRLFINGALARQISGEVNWQSNSFNLPAGTNVLTWQYQTTDRMNVVQGTNTAWVDQVLFSPSIPPPPTVVHSFTNLTLSAGSNCQTSLPDLTGTNYIIAVDSCSSVTVTQSPPAGTLLPLGVTTVVLTAFDTSGNSARSTNSVLVTNTTPPTLRCPADVATIADSGLCSASNVALGTPTVSANCGLAAVTNDAPALFLVGTNLVTWTATDPQGHTAWSTQKVVIVDTELPSITSPAALLVSPDAGQSYASSVSLGTPQVHDNCGIANVSNNAPLHFPIGTNTVIWTVTDVHGNINTAAQQVVVRYTDLPHRITGIVENSDGTFTLSFLGAPEAVYVVQTSTNMLDWNPVQTNTAGGDGTWSYTDANANTSGCPMRLYRAARQ